MEIKKTEQDLIGKRVKRTLLIFLLLMNAFFLFQFVQYKGVRDEIEIQLQQDEAQISNLEKDLEKYITELSKSKALNEQLNDLLKKTYEQIEALRIDISNMEGPGKERLLARISNTEKYLAEIDSLVAENQVLLAENNQLRANIVEERGISSQLRTEKEKLEQELVKKNILFRVEQISGRGMNMAGTREYPTSQAVDIDKIKVCFDVSNRGAAKTVRRKIEIQLSGPRGKVMADGTNKLKQIDLGEGIMIDYSTSLSVNHDSKRKNFCIYINKSIAYKAGKYQLRFYSRGDLIGYSSFMLE